MPGTESGNCQNRFTSSTLLSTRLAGSVPCCALPGTPPGIKPPRKPGPAAPFAGPCPGPPGPYVAAAELPFEPRQGPAPRRGRTGPHSPAAAGQPGRLRCPHWQAGQPTVAWSQMPLLLGAARNSSAGSGASVPPGPARSFCQAPNARAQLRYRGEGRPVGRNASDPCLTLPSSAVRFVRYAASAGKRICASFELQSKPENSGANF